MGNRNTDLEDMVWDTESMPQQSDNHAVDI